MPRMWGEYQPHPRSEVKRMETTQPTFRQILDGLSRQTVTRVFIDQWACGFYADGGLFFRVDGEWSLEGGDGQMLDEQHPFERRQRFDLWRLCGSKVDLVSYYDAQEVPRLIVTFDNGFILTVWSNFKGFTDWEITSDTYSIVSDIGEIYIIYR